MVNLKDELWASLRDSGHADIVRELIDGRIGTSNIAMSEHSDESTITDYWRDRRAEVQAIAEGFR